jgi:hypothetical protein
MRQPIGLSQAGGHEITLYERETRPGGHSATVDVDYGDRVISVDTGFIVYNELNYPQFTAMLAHLGVATHASDMSFAFSARRGAFEWSGRTTQVFDGLFAQRSNLASPGFLKMLLEVPRFNRLAVADRAAGRLAGLSLADYLALRRFSDTLSRHLSRAHGRRDLVDVAGRHADLSRRKLRCVFSQSSSAAMEPPGVANRHRRQPSHYVAALQKPFADRVSAGHGGGARRARPRRRRRDR